MYSHPDTKKTLYIGKGKGNRCFDHLNDPKDSLLLRQIKEIRNQGKEPIIELLRYGLTDNEALLIEAALIDFSDLDTLCNKIRGTHSRTYGRIDVTDLRKSCEAKNIRIDERAMLITINKLYRSNMSEIELYEATRGVWKVGEKRNRAEFAFSLFRGVVKEVYSIDKWHKAGTLKYGHRDPSTFWGTARWEFEGEIAPESIRCKYINKSVREYLKRGSQNPIKYVNC